MDWLETRNDKRDYYLAQICMWIHRSFVSDPEKVTLEEHLIEFQEEEPQQPVEDQKRIWKQILGIPQEKK